ncbi:6-phospho-beta-glucosidase [Treponema sp.]
MRPFKFAITGAGSSYTPELIEGFAKKKDELPVSEIALHDIDEKRMEIMAAFCRRYAKQLGLNVAITTSTERSRALEGASFIDTQIRVGGNAARISDEKIPLSYGLVGQETTGAGGMMKAFRTIPVLLEVAKDVEKYAPDAWIVNYTNPTGLVSEAVNRYSKAKIAGFCSGGIFPKMWAKKALGIDHERVHYDYLGLNHLNFISNIHIDGRLATEVEFVAIAKENDAIDLELIKLLGCIPSPYLQWFYHTKARIEKIVKAGRTRGEQVLELEKEVFASYANTGISTKPEALAKRGGGGYSEIAMDFMAAIFQNRDTWMLINVPNEGAVSFLPDNAVIETGCLVNASGIHPLRVTKVPPMVWGLIAEVKNYEQLAVEAAFEGNKNKALQALIAHPLVRDFATARTLLDEMLEANRQFLPQFFNAKQSRNT